MLYRVRDRYILHRIIKVRENDYVIVGDNCFRKEYGITDEQILGVLTGIVRNGTFMKITENPNKEIVKVVREGLERSGGYCPCRRDRTPDTKCMCKEFRDQIKDPNFEGFCHCMLYYKSLD